MKNFINCDFDKVEKQTADESIMKRRDNKKMPYDRLLMVKATGKYSGKQSDKKCEISHARYLRRRESNQAEKAYFELEQELIEESLMLD